MNSACCICAELINQTSRIFSTSCGHLYHQDCLFQWLTRSNTCPQCRHAESTSTVLRIFLNCSSSEGINNDSVALKAQVDRIARKVLKKDKKIAELKNNCEKYRSECVAMMDAIKQSKKQERLLERRLLTLQVQLSELRAQSANPEDLTEFVDCVSTTDMDVIGDLMDRCQDKASEIQRIYNDPMSLNISVTMLNLKSCTSLLNWKLVYVCKQLLQCIATINQMIDEALSSERAEHDVASTNRRGVKRKKRAKL